MAETSWTAHSSFIPSTIGNPFPSQSIFGLLLATPSDAGRFSGDAASVPTVSYLSLYQPNGSDAPSISTDVVERRCGPGVGGEAGSEGGSGGGSEDGDSGVGWRRWGHMPMMYLDRRCSLLLQVGIWNGVCSCLSNYGCPARLHHLISNSLPLDCC